VARIYAEAAEAPDDDGRKALAKHALKCEAANRLAAMLTLAESEPGIHVLPAQLDADPWLINVLNGTFDLRSGELREHDRRHLLTKVAPVFYEPSATCPTWDAFLTRIMGGNADLISFLQRIAGYSLTGDVSEQVLFLLYGTGANGKSTFLETLRAMIGEEYALQIRPEALMIRNGETVPNDIARLKGARLVSARETEEGKRMAEALVKELTGGDTITARFLRQEYFDFKPEFKLWLAANHKPVIRGTDYAVWRRIKLIPFTVTIPPEEQDKALGRKLLGELEGIFAWAVRGCQDWQRNGLQVPAAVEAATTAYKAESDTLAAFLAERIIQGPNLETQAKNLYEAYKTWCDDNGEKPMTGTMFGRRLTERGFDKYIDGARHTFYIGVALAENGKRE
jgi:putative DNA primase/helicase